MGVSRSVAEELAERVAAIDAQRLPPAVRDTCERLLLDVVGPVRCGARHGLREGGARGLAGCRAGDRDRLCGDAQRGRGGLHQRHGRAWRGFRRHLRGRAGACGRGGGAGRAGGGRAGGIVRAGGADRHCGRCGDHLPVEPGGAEGGAQGGLSPDGGVRRDRRCRGCWRRYATRVSASWSTRWGSRARWRAASSSTWPTAAGPSACIRAGPRNRACARRCWRAPASRDRARCSRACTACSTALRTRAMATTARCSTASASAG